MFADESTIYLDSLLVIFINSATDVPTISGAANMHWNVYGIMRTRATTICGNAMPLTE
jgi:hypothetical protein